MSSYYSIIKYVNNQWSNEYIAVGLIVRSNHQLFFKISERKLKFVQKLSPASFKLYEFSIHQLEDFVEKERTLVKQNSQGQLLQKESSINKSFFDHVYAYNSGLFQFSEPESIEKDFDQSAFDKYFSKIIDDSEEKEKQLQGKNEFEIKIEKKLYQPLKDKVDVDYKLRKGLLPSLYFDFHLDNIGVNGSIIASASIDINHHRIGQLKNKLTEYESVIEKLNKFAKSKGLGSNHSYFLIVNNYKGKTVSNMELDAILKKDSQFEFKRVSTDELDQIVKKVEEKKAHKFSDILE